MDADHNELYDTLSDRPSALLKAGLGSTVVLADAAGTPLTRSRYDAFGSVEGTQVWYNGTWVNASTAPITHTD